MSQKTSIVRGPQLGGVFEWIRGAWKKLAPPIPGGALIPYEEGKKKTTTLPSIFEAFRPAQKEETTLPSIFEAFRPPVAPQEPSGGPLIFAAFKPTLPAPIPEPAPQEATLWEALFEPPPESAGPEPGVMEMFSPPPPEAAPLAPTPKEMEEVLAVQPLPQPELRYYEAEDWGRQFPDIVEKTKGRMPLWVAFNMGWSLPTTMEVAQLLNRHWDLADIFDTALDTLHDQYWQKEAAEAAHRGEPAVLEIEPVGTSGDPYRDVIRYLGVPEHVVDFYAAQRDGVQLLNEEILEPLLERVGKAMEYLKPPPLKGWFMIGPSGGEYWLKYKEAKYPPGNA